MIGNGFHIPVLYVKCAKCNVSELQNGLFKALKFLYDQKENSILMPFVIKKKTYSHTEHP